MAEQPVASPTQKRMTDLLMLADAPWMATVIMGVSQPFAQMRETLGLPQFLPLVVAIIASVLIAAYWVGVEQKTKPLQSLLIVPVVAMTLFSASIGANNVVKAAAGGSQTASSATPSEAPRVEILQQQNEVLQKQLDLEKKKTAILGGSQAPQPSNTSRREDPATAPFLRRVVAWLSPTAYAQPAGSEPDQSHLTNEQRQKLAQLEKAQQALEQKRQVLEQRGQALEAEKALNEGGAAPAPLWKSW